jgi:branched-chain amino acid transport system permease protein
VCKLTSLSQAGAVSTLLQFLIAGLKNGSIYALVALGFTIVFAATGAINFAQGEFYMLGGMLGVYFARLGLPLPLAVAAASAATAAIGAAFELLAVRPISGGDPLRIIMVTIGGAVVLRQLALHIFGPEERALAPFTQGDSIKVLGAAIERQTLWIWALTAVVVVTLAWLYRRTTFGHAMRATSIRRDAARLVGINAGTMVTASFALAAALGALGGLVVAPLTQTAFSVGAGIGVKGFAAAILGGLGRPGGAIGGGLILGLLESLTAGYLNATYKDAVAVVILLVVLFVRPQGLFGGSGRVKV